MNTQQIVAALRLAMECMKSATRAAGPAGAPSDIVFAALQAHGMRLTTYQQILAALVNAGWITIDANHLIRIPTKAATP